MWDVCINTSPTGQRKNKQGPRVQAGSKGLKECHKNLITLLDLCNNVSRGIWTKQRLSQRRRTTASQRQNTKQHGKGKDGPKLRETLIHLETLAEAKHQATRQRKGWPKTSRNIDSKYHETLKTFSRIRELMESSQPENKTLLRESRSFAKDHSGTL